MSRLAELSPLGALSWHGCTRARRVCKRSSSTDEEWMSDQSSMKSLTQEVIVRKIFQRLEESKHQEACSILDIDHSLKLTSPNLSYARICLELHSVDDGR